MKNFITEENINQKRTSSDIANILEIDKNKVDDILTYYLSKNDNLKISLNDFINFMNTFVLKNAKYSEKIDKTARDNLSTLAKYTNKKTIQKKMTSNQIADLFGIDVNLIDELYKYYININEINLKLTISEFSNFVLNDVITNNNYAGNFNQETIQNIKLLATFSDLNIINKNMTSKELSELFGIDENLVKQLLLLKYSNSDNGTKLTIKEFINQVIYIKNNTDYIKDIDTNILENLLKDETIANNPNKYTATQLSSILNIELNKMYNLYALIDFIAK